MQDMMNMYQPRPAFKKELNLNDQWRGRWIDEQELPEYAPVNYAYAFVMMADKGYVTRREDEQFWDTIEGAVEGESAEAFVRRAAKERMGATVGTLDMIGFFECRATSHNPDFAAGSITVRPLYLVVAKKVDDVPDGTGYVRRRLPRNEYMKAMRDRYAEIKDYVGMAGSRYVMLQAKGQG
ncbi:MAG TPA: hypothetical protein VN697_00915 [Tepidiformaceae bacterium]|nr:hypothetical protein [Tepidiformaceae bacterium]